MSVAIENLHFAYGRRAVLSGFDALGLERGTVTAVVGPNGVGKSTLFKLLAGLLRPASGRMSLDGADLAALSPRARTDAIFFLPQHTGMRTALCAFDLVLLARKSGGGRASAEDLRAVEAAFDALGIERLADSPIGELSGGQQQLVAMAQAIVRAPQVLLLDEPTSALDLRRQLQVMDLIRRTTRAKRCVTLVALHDLNLASRYADRFVLIADGKVRVDGAPADVLADAATGHAYGVELRVERSARGDLLVDAHLV